MGGEVDNSTRHLTINVFYAVCRAGVIKVGEPNRLEELFKEELNYKPPIGHFTKG